MFVIRERLYAHPVFLQLAFLREWFHIGWQKNVSGQFHNSRCLYSGLTSLCSSTSWRNLFEFFILWKRPSCHGPLKTYSTKCITSLTEGLTAVQSVTSFPSVISPEQLLPADTSTCLSRRHHFFPWLVKWTCTGGELASINLQSSSPKCKACHFLIKELGLDRVPKLTPQKQK